MAESGKRERIGGSAVEGEKDFAIRLKKFADEIGGTGGVGIIAIAAGVTLVGVFQGFPCFRADA